jgi:hypothetical protein
MPVPAASELFAFEVTGQLGPAVRRALTEFTFEVRATHTVLCVCADNLAQLAPLLDRLEAAGLEVDLIRSRPG